MNRIFPEQLANQLKHRLASIYYLVGNDPLLLSESRDLIIQTAVQQGFDERVEIEINNETDWNSLFERCQSLGLFFSRQILILTLPENPTATIHTQLTELVNFINSDILLILQFPKFAKLFEKQPWHIALLQQEDHLLYINCQTPNAMQLSRWLNLRIKTMNLQLDKEATELLCYSYENNLLALKQSLEMLALLYPDGKLSFQRVKAVIEQSAVFTPYQWIDALFDGKLARAQRILASLQAEDIQPVMLVRILQRELMVVLELAKPQQHIASIMQTLPMHQLKEGMDRLKIWQNRRPFLTAVFQRFTYKQLYNVIQQLAQIERVIKQDFNADVWVQLDDLSLQICAEKSIEFSL
ncbi:MAG: DNA polymerase III subunit delta [Pasteurellaceae bacterium]|nr:DNA polymerase III subunit delta [Pasteurellaceae bacterium]